MFEIAPLGLPACHRLSAIGAGREMSRSRRHPRAARVRSTSGSHRVALQMKDRLRATCTNGVSPASGAGSDFGRRREEETVGSCTYSRRTIRVALASVAKHDQSQKEMAVGRKDPFAPQCLCVGC